MGVMASQITSLMVVYSAVYSGADEIKHQSSASLTFMREIHRGPVNSPHKWPVTQKMGLFDDVIMVYCIVCISPSTPLCGQLTEAYSYQSFPIDKPIVSGVFSWIMICRFYSLRPIMFRQEKTPLITTADCNLQKCWNFTYTLPTCNHIFVSGCSWIEISSTMVHANLGPMLGCEHMLKYV